MIAVASTLATRTTVDSVYGWSALWLSVFGFGFGVLLISGQNLALNTLDEQRAGVGGAILQVMRQTGGVVGIAVLVSVLNSVYRASVTVPGLPVAVTDTVKDSVQAGLAVAERFADPELARAVRTAFLDGMHAEMWLSAGLAVVAAGVVVVAMPRGLGETADRNDGRRPVDRAH
jgi:hypothetical protein